MTSLLQTGKKYRVHLICFALFTATFVLYWPVRHFDYVNFDDPFYISNNWLMQQGLTLKGLAWSFLEPHFGYWHPLVWVSYMVECQLFGPGPVAHHLVNAGLHAVNGVLLFLLLQTLTGTAWRSAFVAALFACHPLRVESVAWITERKDVLSGFFFMLTLLAYVRSVHSHENTALSARWRFFSLALFVLGLLAKPMIITLPFLLLLLDFWPLRRMGDQPLVSLPKLLREKWAFFLLTALFSVITFETQSGDAVVNFISPGARLQNAVMVFPAYMGKLLWPHDLTVLYLVHTGWHPGAVAAAAVLLLGVGMLVLAQWRVRPWMVTGWFWFLGMLVPVCGLVQSGNQFIADRFTYLSSIGFFLLMTWAACDVLARRSERLKVFILGSTAVVCLGLACRLTRAQLSTWKDSIALWNQALRVNPDNHIARNSLGIFLLDHGQVQAAAKEFNQAVKLDPLLVEAWINLGLIALREKDYGRAADQFQHALQIKPNDALALANLGNALRLARDFADAKPFLDKAIRLKPEFLPALGALASFYDDLGQFDQAIPHYQKILAYHPTDALSQCNLAIDLTACRRLPEAMIHYETAIQLDPNNASFHYYHGSALVAAGHPGEGIMELREALRLDGKYLRALNELAWMLATHPNTTIRNGPEAVQLAKRACELTGYKDASSLCGLDAAYAEAGHFPEAIAAAEKARAIFLSMGATNYANKAESRIQLYRSNRPLRN